MGVLYLLPLVCSNQHTNNRLTGISEAGIVYTTMDLSKIGGVRRKSRLCGICRVYEDTEGEEKREIQAKEEEMRAVVGNWKVDSSEEEIRDRALETAEEFLHINTTTVQDLLFNKEEEAPLPPPPRVKRGLWNVTGMTLVQSNRICVNIKTPQLMEALADAMLGDSELFVVCTHLIGS